MIIELVLLAVGIFLLAKFGGLDSKARKSDETLAEAYEAAVKRADKHK